MGMLGLSQGPFRPTLLPPGLVELTKISDDLILSESDFQLNWALCYITFSNLNFTTPYIFNSGFFYQFPTIIAGIVRASALLSTAGRYIS